MFHSWSREFPATFYLLPDERRALRQLTLRRPDAVDILAGG